MRMVVAEGEEPLWITVTSSWCVWGPDSDQLCRNLTGRFLSWFPSASLC